MKRLNSLLGLTIAMAGLIGCASTPNVIVDYYLPKVDLELTVIQTAACSSADEPIMTSDIVITPNYSRDLGSMHELKLKDLVGTFTKGDVEFFFYEDGRLKGLNSTQTGQGGEIIKAAVALKAGMGLLASNLTDCTKLRALDPKALTIKHKGMIDFTNPSIVLDRQSLSDSQFSDVKSIFGDNVKVNYTLAPGPSVCSSSAQHNGVRHCGKVPPPKGTTLVTLATPKIASVEVSAGPNGHEFKFTFEILVPQLGELYTLPIPRPPIFGTTRFGVELSLSGTVTKLKYGKDTGVAAGMTATTDTLTGFSGPATATKAAELKAEADLIAQQQRLIRCQADPSSCS